VPWEATTSYRGGTANGPKAILKASYQVDLFDFEVSKPYEAGLFILPEDKKIRAWNTKAKAAAQKIIKAGGQIGRSKPLQAALNLVNELSYKVNAVVLEAARKEMNAGKIVGLIGGDHASPYGAIAAVAEREESFGILHIDAHSDTRKAYEGFIWSHASIMYNVLETLPQVKKLVQVGIRDFCEEEFDYIKANPDRIETFFDVQLAKRKAGGENWLAIVKTIVAKLPQKVWISFDIDGLDPRLCPNTGTPVPGGLDYHEVVFLIGEVARSGRTIVGFDLNEVAPGKDEWDANVAARLLYKLTAWTLASQRLRPQL
jgi:agmatinase